MDILGPAQPFVINTNWTEQNWQWKPLWRIKDMFMKLNILWIILDSCASIYSSLSCNQFFLSFPFVLKGVRPGFSFCMPSNLISSREVIVSASRIPRIHDADALTSLFLLSALFLVDSVVALVQLCGLMLSSCLTSIPWNRRSNIEGVYGKSSLCEFGKNVHLFSVFDLCLVWTWLFPDLGS